MNNLSHDTETETQAGIKGDTKRRYKQIQSREREIRLYGLQNAVEFEIVVEVEGVYNQFSLDATLEITYLPLAE